MDPVRSGQAVQLAGGYRWKFALDRAGAPIPRRSQRLHHDVQDMAGVLGSDPGRFLSAHAGDQVPEPVGPGPVRMRFFKELPASGRVLPQLVAVRIPIVPRRLIVP